MKTEHPLTVQEIALVRERIAEARRAGGDASVGFVPTMGALHEGHLALIDRARVENDFVVVSIFVNPTQFRPGEDLDKYPRQFERDAELAAERGTDLLFAPSPNAIYPEGYATTVSVRGVSETLCGHPLRRGHEHFDGVATVVAKLFNIVRPDRAYFGQKDAQQVAVIRQMTRDLDLPVEIVACPTVREADGLALSSRNAYLSAEQRERALALWRSLAAARDAVAAGERDAVTVVARAVHELDGLELEYFELVDPQTMQPVASVQRPVLAAVAARCGETRLIDNLLLVPAAVPADPDDGNDGAVHTIPTKVTQGAAA